MAIRTNNELEEALFKKLYQNSLEVDPDADLKTNIRNVYGDLPQSKIEELVKLCEKGWSSPPPTPQDSDLPEMLINPTHFRPRAQVANYDLNLKRLAAEELARHKLREVSTKKPLVTSLVPKRYVAKSSETNVLLETDDFLEAVAIAAKSYDETNHKIAVAVFDQETKSNIVSFASITTRSQQ